MRVIIEMIVAGRHTDPKVLRRVERCVNNGELGRMLRCNAVLLRRAEIRQVFPEELPQ